MTTADTTKITADTTCVTADGLDDCKRGGGNVPKAPLLRDDEDLLDIITMIARKLF